MGFLVRASASRIARTPALVPVSRYLDGTLGTEGSQVD